MKVVLAALDMVISFCLGGHGSNLGQSVVKLTNTIDLPIFGMETHISHDVRLVTQLARAKTRPEK